MNTAEQLRQEIANSNIIDKQKVLESVVNGIRQNGYCLVWEPYSGRSKIVYGSGSIEIARLEEEEAIRQYVLSQGFHVRRAFHPASGREYGFEVRL